MRNQLGKMFVVSVLTAVMSATPLTAQVVNTDFEAFGGFGVANWDTDFTIGTLPNTAQFLVTSGIGGSGIAGVGALYTSGTHAWMLMVDTGENAAGSTGDVLFATPADTVTFFARNSTVGAGGAQSSGVFRLFDGGGVQLGSDVPLTNAFTLYTIDSGTLGAAIARIEFTNLTGDGAANGSMISLDDFSFTPIPEPMTGALLGIGLTALFFRRRRRFSARELE